MTPDIGRCENMRLTKTEYILRSISKIRNKKWEFYIITRIIHALHNDIEFITQQLVRLPDGRHALTDIYFPQFDIHLEIDEKHHNNTVTKDFKRDRDIIQITNHKLERIKISDNGRNDKSLCDIDKEVDEFITKLVNLKDTQRDFTAWNYEQRFSADHVIKKGVISTDDNIAFQTQIEALRCFGFKGAGYQRGAWRIKNESDDVVWFPRLFEHGMWHNMLTRDGLRIEERALNNNEPALKSIALQKNDAAKFPNRSTIVFAKAKDSLGFNLLRYVGTFSINLAESSNEIIIFDRIRKQEKIIP